MTERLATTLGVSALAFATLALGMASGQFGSFDGAIALWLHTNASGFVTVLLSGVTRLGGAQVLLAVTLAAALWLLVRRRVAYAALMGAALAGAEALNAALKGTFERPRPSFEEPLATAAGFSFPSGHAMVSLTVYGGLAFVIAVGASTRRERVLVVGSALALVLAIGFSRVYLGVHYASDVLAAYCAGLAWLALCGLTLMAASRRTGRLRCRPGRG
jgi:membrane-associated phospholipid phosphatase